MVRQPFYSPLRLATFIMGMTVALSFALLPLAPRQRLPVVGEIASEPVLANADLAYASALLTEEARQQAVDAVAPFLTFDAGVRTAQGASLANLISRIDTIRGNDSLSTEEKSARLAALPDLDASARAQVLLLGLPEDFWRQVADEAVTLLTGILTQNITAAELASIRAEVRNRVSSTIAPTQADVVAQLVTPFVQPNVTIDAAATATAQAEAAAAVQPVPRTFPRGQVIVPAGAAVDALAAEALAQLQPEGGGIPGEDLVAVLILAAASAVTLGAYLALARPVNMATDRRLLLLGLLVVGTVAAVRWYVPAVLPGEADKSLELVLPVTAVAILSAALLESTLGLVVATVVAALAGFAVLQYPDWGVGQAPEGVAALRGVLAFLFAGVAGVFAASRVQRVTQYGVAGAVSGAALFVVGLAIWLLGDDRSADALGWLALVSVAAALSTGILAIGAFSTLGLLFGITTRLQLLELAQLTHPLLRRLQEEAPGTFHHSLLVATMAERAANQIQADPLLVRVGAYYHDIGKLSRPEMYIENQGDGPNPHDAIDPRESAQVIQAHVRWGAELARRYRLPERVRAFIPEHHGTRLVTYFYRKAAQKDPSVDPALFTYKGPRPQTSETAIVMLADSCEAVVRSSHQRDPETIDRLVDAVLGERLGEHQLDESDLTLRQLWTVGESFKVTLRGVYHPRIAYPEPTDAERRQRLPTGVSAAPQPRGDHPVDGSAPPDLAGRSVS